MTTPRFPPIPVVPVDEVARRRFLKLMAASLALAGGGCSGPPGETIVPYVQMPENLVPGQPLFYASSLVRRGLGQGVLVESNMGRPTKVEGNRGHPASLGATDVFAQASVLQCWDPDRSQTVRQGDAVATWGAFETALADLRARLAKRGGAGLRILTGALSSPTMLAQMDALQRQYPQARWHSHDPLHDTGAGEAARLAFGAPLDTVYQLGKASVLVCLDADLLGDWPGQIAYARAFTQARAHGQRAFANRLYALEASPSITGAFADERLARAPADIEAALWRIASRLGVGTGGGQAPDAAAQRWEAAVAKALGAARGQAAIVAGPSLSAGARALALQLNHALGNSGATVLHIAPVVADGGGSIAELVRDMHAGQVEALFMLDVNPVYDAPADLGFGEALGKVALSVHQGLYFDESGRRAHWHLPATHVFEEWGDARAFDGTAGIVQPVMVPLYQGRPVLEVLAQLTSGTRQSTHALVRRIWQAQAPGDFEQFWQTSLREGVVAGSASAPRTVKRGAVAAPPPPPGPDSHGLRVLFTADPSVGGGEFANNGWLQELPRPLTSLTWDNAAMLSPATAKAVGVTSGDMVRLELEGRALVAPVLVIDEHADHCVALPLGYGRTAAGRVGNGVGFDAYRLRTTAAMHGGATVRITKAAGQHDFALRQVTMDTHGRDMVRFASVAQWRAAPAFAQEPAPARSLYPEQAYTGYKWGMSIDLNACIGCGTCTIACQAENNIPVVGKEEVAKGREMHWIRVDRYVSRGRSLFQPVPCMHCEKAPCEEVCPVGATVHDSEGLNVQVYNRCVGTRFCSNNCPYKVRRFNFFAYSNTEEESLMAAQNPEVTVRRRGVMEKCSYCLQRVTRARLDAERLGRPIQDGEVVTACQAACPTQAIVFGDLNDPASRVSLAKQSVLDYALLAELNTRPRTTYLARVVNPDPELE